MDKRCLSFVGFSDASFANSEDPSTRLGHVVFLTDSSDKVVPLVFNSYNYRRVTVFAMDGEVIDFRDMFDVIVTLAEEPRKILGYRPPTHLLTDSKSFFDVILKGFRISEK